MFKQHWMSLLRPPVSLLVHTQCLFPRILGLTPEAGRARRKDSSQQLRLPLTHQASAWVMESITHGFIPGVAHVRTSCGFGQDGGGEGLRGE